MEDTMLVHHEARKGQQGTYAVHALVLLIVRSGSTRQPSNLPEKDVDTPVVGRYLRLRWSLLQKLDLKRLSLLECHDVNGCEQPYWVAISQLVEAS